MTRNKFRKVHKIMLITAGLLVIFGAGISAAAIAFGADREPLGDVQTKLITEEISAIEIAADTDDIRVIGADTDKIKLTYTTGKTKQYSFSSENGKLILKSIPRRNLRKSWTSLIDLNFSKTPNQITLELPKGYAADTVLDTKYGDIYVSNICGNVTSNVACGDILIADCTPAELICKIDYGDIELNHVTADSADISNSCGDIEADTVTAAKLSASCDYGDIEFNRLLCDDTALTNECGDIECRLIGSESDYSINAETSLGDRNIPNKTSGLKVLRAETSLGDVEIKFTNR